MSEAAVRERAVRHHRAEPGSGRDRLIKIAKIALPSAVGVLFAFLALAPFDKEGDVSFILDRNEVETAPERMRVEAARYAGEDNKGQKFVLRAGSAVQQSEDVPIVDIADIHAELGLTRGPVRISAQRGRYNIEQQQLGVLGPVRVIGRDGEELATSNVLVDLETRRVQSSQPVVTRLPVGVFSANSLQADLGTRQVTAGGGVRGQVELGSFQAARARADLNTRVVVLDGGVRLKIRQGAVR